METWPLWICLKPEQLKSLAYYQWHTYGTKLDILCKPEIEDLEEIDKLIRQAPTHPKRVK